MNDDERIVCPGMKEEDVEETSLRPKWLKEKINISRFSVSLEMFGISLKKSTTASFV